MKPQFKTLIGYKDGMAVYVDDALIAQEGINAIRSHFGLMPKWPFRDRTSMYHHSGSSADYGVVWVEADTYEEALEIFWKCKSKTNDK